MISKLTEFPNEFSGYDVFSVKIECDFHSYKNFEFAQFFYQHTSSKATAVISLIDNIMCISQNNADIPELAGFINFLNPKKIICKAGSLPFACENQILIMKCSCKDFGNTDAKFNQNPTAGEVYSALLKFTNGKINLPERDSFISDFSFKQRRNSAMALISQSAVALSSSITPSAAYISAVAVAAESRFKGHGSAVLKAIINSLKKDTVYLFCEPNTAEFYLKQGFYVDGKVSIMERNNHEQQF